MNNLYVSTACLKGDKSYNRVIEEFHNNGIDNIELTGVHPHLEDSALEGLIKGYKEKGINFTFHNYFPPPKKPMVLNYISTNPKVRKECKEIISSAISLAKRTGVKVYAFHPGYYREADVNPKGYFDFLGERRKSFDYGFEVFKNDFVSFYKSLEIDNDQSEVCLGFENLFPNADGTNDSFMCNYDEISKIFKQAEKDNINLKLLIDLGHLAISSNIMGFDKYEFIEKIVKEFGHRIFEVHISENDGKNDLHNRIKENSWQLRALEIFKKLKNFKKIIFTYESRGMSIEEIKNDVHLINQRLLTNEKS